MRSATIRAPKVMPLARETDGSAVASEIVVGLPAAGDRAAPRQPGRSRGRTATRSTWFGRLMLATAVVAGSSWAVLSYITPPRLEKLTTPVIAAVPEKAVPPAPSSGEATAAAPRPAPTEAATVTPKAAEPPAQRAAPSAPHWWRNLQEKKQESAAVEPSPIAAPDATPSSLPKPMRPAPAMRTDAAEADTSASRPRPIAPASAAKVQRAAERSEARPAAPKTYEDDWRKRLNSR